MHIMYRDLAVTHTRFQKMIFFQKLILATSLLTTVTCVKNEKKSFSSSVGILYEVWHANAATSMRIVKEKGYEQLTTERVIRSDGNKSLDDVYKVSGLPSLDIYNAEPEELGFYCLYRKRDGDTSPPIPDCRNTSGVAERHARLLVDSQILRLITSQSMSRIGLKSMKQQILL
jgi:hypothetical protein